ncbi:20 kDa chloroplastic isoform B [Chlorella sorokiniana]|uniref:20 kDa chloroplastic isoform B n=1 Tax=Chlorella sorokiniana TaxID=3076 RepID=A0A2P6TJA6_CHLSO|nr:20 kDa chloroplastic isoform B [Chlorella sorokiniana]|eukprot:PRW39336.1 20 kDa chloroplastic isoform B [Chlorella sorokiniana]
MSSKRAPPLPQATLDDLVADELLLRILCCLPPAQRPSLPLVCRRWRALCEGAGPLWEELFLNFRHIYNSSLLYKWLLPRRGCVRALTAVTETEEDWLSLHLVLGLVAAGLERLVVRAGREGLGMASVDWLGVLTQLKSLQMDFDRDSLVHEAAFPPGLESLVLRPVAFGASLRVSPKGLDSVTALTNLQLRLLDMPDAPGDDSERNGWYRLLHLTRLQRLAITSSTLACMPEAVSALAALTSLNLSACELSFCLTAPGGLTPLSTLKSLALLNLSQCSLDALPPPVAALPALRTLLLFDNNLQGLPEGSYLGCLEALDLNTNQLAALPRALLGCSRLEALDLDEAVRSLDAQSLRQLLTANPHMRELRIGSSVLPTSQLAKLQTAFPRVRVVEVEPSASRPKGRDGGSLLLGSASSSSDDDSDEEWEGEEGASGSDSEGGDGGSGEGEEESAEVDYPSLPAAEEGEEDEDSGMEEDQEQPFTPAKRLQLQQGDMAGRSGPGPTLQRLPDACLIAIFSALSPLERRVLVPFVCKRWRQLFRNSPPLWQQAHLALPADFVTSVDMAALFAWFVERSGDSSGGSGSGSGSGGDANGGSGSKEAEAIQSLHVDVSTAAAWGPTLGVLGVVGRRLRHLRIAGDSPQCQMVGCSAPWLALCPNLVSLELDDVVDQSIGDCTVFPTGLTRLELSYCGEEGLYSIPTHLTRCTRLHTLTLNCAIFDHDLPLDLLGACTTIQYLDLSNCCLTRVPPVLARLPHLTSLTLNDNDALGASDDALAPLSTLTSLQLLEMRECGLRAVPASITALPALRSLLMGYNLMTERPFLPPGPYLSNLRVLAMSDAKGFQDDSPWDELSEPLVPAMALEVLRINRCLGLQLSIEEVEQLLAGKPRFRKLEFTADMLADERDLLELRRRHPQVTFKAVE